MPPTSLPSHEAPAPPGPILDPQPDMDTWPPYQAGFSRLLNAEPGIRGRVLDVGCGPALPGNLTFVASRCEQVDGVDPGADVEQHPSLTLRWRSTLEDAPVPEGVYDLAYAFNVVEHIAAPVPFMRAVHRALKPGGVFWALTPHANHPFAVLSRMVELAGFKGIIARRNSGVNHYAAYYRVNRRRSIRRAISGLGFDAPEFRFFATPGWEQGYVPRGLKWGPRAWDFLLGNRFDALKQIIAFRLRRSV